MDGEQSANEEKSKHPCCVVKTWVNIIYVVAFMAFFIVAMVQMSNVAIKYASKPVVVQIKVSISYTKILLNPIFHLSPP